MSAPERDRKRGPRRSFGPLVCIVMGLWLAAAPVLGQTGAGNPVSVQDAVLQSEMPKERTALTLSVVGALIPFGLAALMAIPSDEDFGIPGLYIPMALTLFAGPSAGFFYGGCWGRGLLTTGLRLGATYIVVSHTMKHDEVGHPTLLWTYGVGMAVSIVWDLATVKRAVGRRNEARLARRGPTVAAAPIALPKGAGVLVRLSF